MPLLLVQGFANTVDVDEGSDLFADPGAASDWFADAGLLTRRVRLSPDDIAFARAVRTSVRSLLRRNAGEAIGAAELEPLRELAGARRPRLVIGKAGQVELENPGGERLEDALFELLLIIHHSQDERSWGRLKICACEECQWAFYDRSRNQKGNWCDMAVCGNRIKNRQLRARRA